MAGFLTDEWLAALGADRVALDDVTAEITVVGAPGGDVKWHARVTGGTLIASAGGAPDADIVLTLPYDDAVAVARGESEASVAFMRGKMKTAGDPGRLLDLLAATATPQFAAARDGVAGTTEF